MIADPLVIEFEVGVPPAQAFDTWTQRCATWWPSAHTVSGDPSAISFEPRPGGRIGEHARGGGQHDWGKVLDWEPPARLRYLWHLFFDSSEATEVEITFSPLGGRTAVRLEQRGWEQLGEAGPARRARTERAMRGTYGAYSVQDFTVGAEREVRQGTNVADAARAVRVEHLVYSSVGGADRDSGIDHWESKWQIEQHIRRLGLPATVIRPASFMENYYIPAVEKGLLKGRLVDPIKAGKPYQTIATDDVGKFVAVAFERPDGFVGVQLEIAGSELANDHAAAVFARVLGRPVTFRRLPMPVVRVAMGKELHQMFRWFNDSGHQADIPGLRARFPSSSSGRSRTGCATRAGRAGGRSRHGGTSSGGSCPAPRRRAERSTRRRIRFPGGVASAVRPARGGDPAGERGTPAAPRTGRPAGG